jgi:hypothetical protein
MLFFITLDCRSCLASFASFCMSSGGRYLQECVCLNRKHRCNGQRLLEVLDAAVSSLMRIPESLQEIVSQYYLIPGSRLKL